MSNRYLWDQHDIVLFWGDTSRQGRWRDEGGSLNTNPGQDLLVRRGLINRGTTCSFLVCVDEKSFQHLAGQYG